MNRSVGDTSEIIEQLCGPLAGRRVLDIGCGRGQLLQELAARGAQVAGIDIDEDGLEAARQELPGARFHKGSARQLPLPDASVHIAVFLNSLHHMESGDMLPALAEAARVVGAGGSVLVVEPLSEGSFLGNLMFVADEAAARQAAQDAMLRAARIDHLREIRRLEYDCFEAFADADAFLARVLAAAPAREPLAPAEKQKLLARFAILSERDARGCYLLRQPLRLYHLKVPIKRPPPINPRSFG